MLHNAFLLTKNYHHIHAFLNELLVLVCMSGYLWVWVGKLGISSTLQGNPIYVQYSFSGNCAASVPIPHSCDCDRFIYSQDRYRYFPAAEQADRSWKQKYIKLSQIQKCRNWETEQYYTVLEIFISGNTDINRNQTFILDSRRPFICSVQDNVHWSMQEIWTDAPWRCPGSWRGPSWLQALLTFTPQLLVTVRLVLARLFPVYEVCHNIQGII